MIVGSDPGSGSPPWRPCWPRARGRGAAWMLLLLLPRPMRNASRSSWKPAACRRRRHCRRRRAGLQLWSAPWLWHPRPRSPVSWVPCSAGPCFEMEISTGQRDGDFEIPSARMRDHGPPPRASRPARDRVSEGGRQANEGRTNAASTGPQRQPWALGQSEARQMTMAVRKRQQANKGWSTNVGYSLSTLDLGAEAGGRRVRRFRERREEEFQGCVGGCDGGSRGRYIS